MKQNVLAAEVSFTPNSARFGRGDAFFDRFFSSPAPQPAESAICFNIQVVDSVDREEHDANLDAVVTD